ncbi:uncharacterized protein K02A2.6-like [Musca vetustissima]|uniref:uncharacterized protein K02A2.6-like n=1 Tax=Musca vetustissima TaxID=27455 RepID=UPI002AB7A3E3|nr:uncharacterized protein K02A2.6-like [Musca vetustissima]
MLLVVTDAYSKWIEVKITSSTSSAATIDALDELFASYGVPITIVSDNGTGFASEEFKDYLTRIGVKYHKFTAPYHPSTNGQAERSIQTIKAAMKIMKASKENLQSRLNQYLRHYRIPPHATTGKSPDMLFLGRTLRTRFDLMKPEEFQFSMAEKQYSKFTPTYRVFEPMQEIYFLSNNKRMNKWLKGIIVRRTGDVHYEILHEGKEVRRHVDQIRGRVSNRRNGGKVVTIAPTESRNVIRCSSPPQSHSTAQGSIDNSDDENIVTSDHSLGEIEPEEATLEDGFITPQSDFHGFTSGNIERTSNTPQQEPCVLPRRSSRPRRQRVLFSPQ